MSANLNSLPGAVAAVQLAMNGAGESATSAVASQATDADAHGNAQGGFSALFQRLLGRQGLVEADIPMLTGPAGTAATDDATDAAGNLQALLPFLEAMGLVHNDSRKQAAEGDDADAIPMASDTAENLLAAITPAITTAPANSAGPISGNPTGLAATLSGITESSEGTSQVTAGQSLPNSSTTIQEASAGREFAAKLTAAIEGSKETAPSPGTVAASVQQVVIQAVPSKAHSATSSLPISQAVGSAGWSDEVGNKVVWLANRQESRAELVLNPPQMGRVEVSLSVNGDHATANFVSASPAVREALEAALPRLREILAEAGIQLGQAQVGNETAQQSAQQEKNPDNLAFDRHAQPDGSSLNTAPGPIGTSVGLKMGRGLVDVFA